MKVYKLPKELVSELREIKGSQGSRINPIEDANGNYVISSEEIESEEFDLSRYEFEVIEFEPKKVNFRITK